MKITVETRVSAPLHDVWRAFNEPDDILQWDVSDAWQVVRASNDLRVGGRLEMRIDARDGGPGLDFAAIYTLVRPNRLIEMREMHDNRRVRVEFAESGSGTVVRQTFDADPAIPHDEERADWQGVLDGFGRYADATGES